MMTLSQSVDPTGGNRFVQGQINRSRRLALATGPCVRRFLA